MNNNPKLFFRLMAKIRNFFTSTEVSVDSVNKQVDETDPQEENAVSRQQPYVPPIVPYWFMM